MSSSSRLKGFLQRDPILQTSRENAMAAEGPCIGYAMVLEVSYLCHFGPHISAGGSRALCSKDRGLRGNVRPA